MKWNESVHEFKYLWIQQPEFLDEFIYMNSDLISWHFSWSWIHIWIHVMNSYKISSLWIHMLHFMTYEFRYEFKYMNRGLIWLGSHIFAFAQAFKPQFWFTASGKPHCVRAFVQILQILRTAGLGDVSPHSLADVTVGDGARTAACQCPGRPDTEQQGSSSWTWNRGPGRSAPPGHVAPPGSDRRRLSRRKLTGSEPQLDIRIAEYWLPRFHDCPLSSSLASLRQPLRLIHFARLTVAVVGRWVII